MECWIGMEKDGSNHKSFAFDAFAILNLVKMKSKIGARESEMELESSILVESGWRERRNLTIEGETSRLSIYCKMFVRESFFR